MQARTVVQDHHQGLWLLIAAVCALVGLGCPTAASPDSSRPAKADKWYRRAQQEYRLAQMEAAHDSARHALDIVPADEQVRLLAARVALARLEFAEAVRLLRGIPGSEARGLRGRAHWYQGELELAADELEAMLADPDVVDPWGKGVAKLARHGIGRKPYALSGGLLAVEELVQLGPSAPFFVVPVEIDGAEALALVATGNAEVVLDSATRQEPSWVSLRLGKRLEIQDVPALTQDLSGLSAQFGVPIKALLGAHFLRRLNATVDLLGRQFVARSFVPPPPPVASRVDLYHLRGGGMVMSTTLGKGDRAALFVDSTVGYPVALDREGWGKLGVDAQSLPAVPNEANDKLRQGSIPLLHFGAFELPQVSAMYGVPTLDQLEQQLGIDVDGVLGAGLLSRFRLTFSDGGRVLWVEQHDPVTAPPSVPGAPAGNLPGWSTPGPIDPNAPAPMLPAPTSSALPAPPSAPSPTQPAPTSTSGNLGW